MNSVTTLAFSPDGRRLALGSYDLSVQLWVVENSTLLWTFEGSTDAVTSVAFSPDGLMLASVDRDGSLLLWGAKSLPIPHLLRITRKMDRIY